MKCLKRIAPVLALLIVLSASCSPRNKQKCAAYSHVPIIELASPESEQAVD